MSRTKVLILLIIILAVGFFGAHKYEALKKVQSIKAASVQKPAITTPPPAEVFQPEGQMLTQAIDAKEAVSAASTSPASSFASKDDHPVTAAKNLPPYVYDSTLCVNSTAPYLCLAQLYKDLTNNYGASVAISDIKQRYNQNSTAASDCHPLMHVIGRTAANAYATTAEAFQHGDVFCWSGYYHGILEGMVAKIGLKNLPNELNNICADIPGKATYNFDYYNCVHGLGHGIMAELEDEVFDSLKMCDNLNGNWEQESCYSGVFMQNIIDSTNVADTDSVVKYLKPSDPLYPCDAVGSQYQYQCYLGQTSYALQVTNYNFPKVFQLCATVAEPNRDTCFQSLGRDSANQAYHDAAKTKSTCALATDANDRSNCIIGAVKEIISYYHDITQANGFCSILDQPDQTTCQQTGESYYKNF